MKSMDWGTVLGLIMAIGTTYVLFAYEGDLKMFVNKHAGMVIVGGVVTGVLLRFPLKTAMSGLVAGFMVPLMHRTAEPRELVEVITELADLARKKGPIALETADVEYEFLAKGVRMIADGYEASFIRETLERERDLHATRLEDGVKIYKSIGDAAPACGMIGTLIGMVAMFANMSDPSKLGPAMATALLATLYGALLANFMCLPLAEKLELKLHHDEVVETMVIDGVLLIREGKSPGLIREMLQTYIPKKHREEEDEDQAAAA
jgi:chemotaxis protein MotA